MSKYKKMYDDVKKSIKALDIINELTNGDKNKELLQALSCVGEFIQSKEEEMFPSLSEDGKGVEITLEYEDEICVGDNVKIKILKKSNVDGIRLGITAPRDVPVHREEVYKEIVNFKNAAKSLEDQDHNET